MIKVLVNGAKGRMGQEAVKAIAQDSELELVDQTDAGDDLSARIRSSQCQVVVDFTLASVGFENAKIILESGARPVIGTSGFDTPMVEKLSLIAREKSLGGIIAPNFAIGAVLMMKFAREAARYLPDVEVIELHHDKKEDFPSGTALKTAELISEGRGKDIFIKEDQGRAVYHAGVPIHSVRLPGYVAHEEVLFGGVSQTLSIRHDSIHRESFMPGVVLSCKKVMTLDTLVFGLDTIL
jgi:4-hydroxy-tetrahydrodipicolinate reductase